MYAYPTYEFYSCAWTEKSIQYKRKTTWKKQMQSRNLKRDADTHTHNWKQHPGINRTRFSYYIGNNDWLIRSASSRLNVTYIIYTHNMCSFFSFSSWCWPTEVLFQWNCPLWSFGVCFASDTQQITLPETNTAPENKVSQKESSFHTSIFQGLC